VASFRQTRYGWRAEVFRHGVRRSESAFRTKAAAVAWASRTEAEIMAGVRGEVPNLTVKAILERYRNEVSPAKKGARWEVIRLMGMERDRIAQVRLRLLDAPHVADWQRRRLQAVSSASVRRERNLLNNVFEIAIKEFRWLRKNPFTGVRRPKDGKPRNRLATDGELKKLHENASPTMSRVITIAVETGMRAGEIASQPKIHGRVAYLTDTKNGTAREIPLSAKAAEAWGGGIELTAGSISGLFARLCKDAGITGLTFHDLRHVACTRLAEKLTVLELCAMMGWKDPRHAMIYYNKTTADIAGKL
jgi:integrase